MRGDISAGIRPYLRLTWSGRWLILAMAGLGIVVGTLVSATRAGTYAASSRISLGRPTSQAGIVIPSPIANPSTAPSALDVTGLADRTAQHLGLPASAVRNHITLATPPGLGPRFSVVLVITAKNARATTAVDLANEFANQAMADVGRNYATAQRALATQIAKSDAQIHQLTRRIAAAGNSTGATPSAALTLASETQLLATAQASVASARTTLASMQQTEVPVLLAAAHQASPTITRASRVRSIILAGIVGALIGLITTLLWRGSPTRLREETDPSSPQATTPG